MATVLGRATGEGPDGRATIRADELERAESLSRSILRNLPGSAVLLLDAKLCLRLAEGPALEPYGLRTEIVRGRPLRECVPGELGEALAERYRQVLDGDPVSFELPLDERHHIVNAVPVANADGTVEGVMAVSLDVTERHRAEETLRASERDFRLLAENATDFVSRHDPDGRLLYASPSARSLTGYEPEELAGRSGYKLVHPDDHGRLREQHERVLHDSGSSTFTFRLRRKDGSTLWAETSCRAVRGGESDAVTEIHGVTRDVGERKRAQEELERRVAQQSAVAALGEQALRGDELGRLMNSACVAVAETLDVELCGVFRITGRGDRLAVEAGTGWLARLVGRTYSPEITDDPRELVACLADGPVITDDLAEETRFQATALRDQGARSAVNVLIGHGDFTFGVLGAYSNRRRVFTGEDANFLQAVGHIVGTAIERQHTEDRARHEALHDPLTGMPNRSLLLDRLEQALARCERHDTRVALLFLDLDHFKLVNDSLGHSAGDELLRAIAPRLRTAVGRSGTVARFGGDEFVILADDADDERTARLLAERIAASFASPFVLRGESHVVSASIGVVMAGECSVAAEDLVRDADAAMYRAKERGRGRYEVFDDAMRARVVGRLRTENELRRALEEDELVVHYQPYLSLPERAIAGVEALVRWRHPDRGLLAPSDFIPVAEESGLIVPLGAVVLRQACRDAARWREVCARADDVRLTVNLSARQAAQPGLVDLVAACLEETGLHPNCLGLELTESVVMEEASSSGETLDRLRELGVRLVIDDFGTGYSSLAYLPRLSLDVLKIDRSFVAGLGAEDGSEAIVTAIVGMASALGLPVIPEGIETEQQLARLEELGCRYGQGFLFSPPVLAADIERMIATGAGGNALPGLRSGER